MLIILEIGLLHRNSGFWERKFANQSYFFRNKRTSTDWMPETTPNTLGLASTISQTTSSSRMLPDTLSKHLRLLRCCCVSLQNVCKDDSVWLKLRVGRMQEASVRKYGS